MEKEKRVRKRGGNARAEKGAQASEEEEFKLQSPKKSDMSTETASDLP